MKNSVRIEEEFAALKSKSRAYIPDEHVPRKTYIPVGCLVALHVLPPDELASGLVLPENLGPTGRNQIQSTRCIVVAVGPDCKWVKEGDEVLCVNDAVLIVHKGHKTALVREDNIAGIVIKE